MGIFRLMQITTCNKTYNFRIYALSIAVNVQFVIYMEITPLGLNVFVVERAQFGQERGVGSLCMLCNPSTPHLLFLSSPCSNTVYTRC